MRAIYLLANVAVIAILGGLGYLLHRGGWNVALAFFGATALHYTAFWLHYGWTPDFNMDGKDAENYKLPALRR